MSDYWKKNGIKKPQSIIVCAANKFPNGVILLGARHWDKHMRMQADQLNKDRVSGGREEQGFIDQFGDFYDRKEALKIVKQSGQSFDKDRNGCDGKGDELYSEGLY